MSTIRLTSFLLGGLLALASASTSRADKVDAFALASADVPKVVVLVSPPHSIILEVTYSKPKQAELRQVTTKNLPVTISVTLAGNPAGSRTFTAPAHGHSIKFAQPSLDAAFAFAEALTFPASAPATLPTATPTTGADHLPAIAPADVTKVELFIYKPNRVYLEITQAPKTSASPGKTVRLDMPSLAAAFAQTRLLTASLLKPSLATAAN